MNSNQILQQTKQDYSEWLEMSENPDALVSGILAGKIVKLKDHIEYLERRLNHVRSNV